MNANALRVFVYERNSTTPVFDSGDDLKKASDISFGTYFPGGLFGAATIPIPRQVTRAWPFRIGQRLVIRNGLTTVYEGDIVTPGYTVGQGATQGRSLEAAGAWESVLGKWGWNKPWADNRMSEDVWRKDSTRTQGTIKRDTDSASIRLVPKGVAVLSGAVVEQMRYDAPTGETVKRFKCSYNMQEAAQAWTLAAYNQAAAANIWTATASGAGVRDDTFGTPSQRIDVYLQANANQTPTEDDTYYGQIDDAVSGANAFMVYTETGTINLEAIAGDIIARVTDLNSSTSLVNAAAASLPTLEPFITNGYEIINSILARAAAFGDSSYNSWYARLLESDRAPTPDGKPIAEVAQWPPLTDYEYVIRAEDKNISGFELKEAGDNIWNYIVLHYRDTQNNRDVWVTPDDDANLTDATSVSAYGRRTQVIDCGQCTNANAIVRGRRFLANHKDKRFYVSGPITVTDYIRGKSGNKVPAANIRAGQRVKIENFLTDEVGVSGAGLTFIIMGTQYQDSTRTNALQTGRPDDMAVFLAQLAEGIIK